MTLPSVPRLPERYGPAWLPTEVDAACREAQNAAVGVRLSRAPHQREALLHNLRALAAANKTLAAYNPGLIVKPSDLGGAS